MMLRLDPLVLICFLCTLIFESTFSRRVVEYDESKTCGEMTKIPQLISEEEQAKAEDEVENTDNNDKFETRVRMGTAVTNKRYPWMVAVHKDGVGVMGAGALITKRYVLSAAHCFYTRRRRGLKPSDYKFYVGFLNLNQKPIRGRMKIFEATKIHVHAKFDLFKHSDDIALVRLNESIPDSMFNFKYARTICLPKANTALKKFFTVAGWGNNGTDGVSAVPNLFEAKVDLFRGSSCPNRNNICTKSRPADVCEVALPRNDSGGPLMQLQKNNRMTIVGVVSHGPNCWDENEAGATPGIFTDVRKYLDWIKEKMNSDEQ